MRKRAGKFGRTAGKLTAFLVLASLVLGGCGKTAVSGGSDADEKETDLTIGFVVKNKNRDYWKLMQAGAGEECEAKNAELIFLGPGEDNDAQEQIEEVKKLTEQKVDVICVCPVSDEMLLPALQDAADAGIYVIAVDTDSALEQKVTYVGTDNYSAARAGAIRASKDLGDGANAVVLRGYYGDNTNDARESGITDGLTEQDVRVEKSVETSADKAKEDTAAVLAEYPQLSLLITTNDDLTAGAYEAIEESGRTDVKLYGFDGSLDIVKKISDDSFLIGTTAQNPYEMGTLAVDNACLAVSGGEIQQNVYSAYEIVDSDSAEAYIEKREKFEEKIGDSVDE